MSPEQAVIFKRLQEILLNQFGIDPSEVSEEAYLDELMDDSLDLIEMVMAIETEFNIDVPDEDVEKCIYVLDLVRLVESRIEK